MQSAMNWECNAWTNLQLMQEMGWFFFLQNLFVSYPKICSLFDNDVDLVAGLLYFSSVMLC